MPMTTFLANELGDHAFRNSSWTSPTNTYLGLSLTNPTAAGLQTGEVTGTGYARVVATAKMGAFSGGVSVNTTEFDFGTPGSDWGTPAYVFLADASSGGNILAYEQIPSPRAVLSGGRPVKFGVGQVRITITT